MTEPKVIFETVSGARRELTADHSGMSVMELATHHGIQEIIGECGGSLSCATCHAYVDQAWLDRLPPPNEDELAMLDGALNLQDNSRLTCQLIITPELDGMIVYLPASQY